MRAHAARLLTVLGCLVASVGVLGLYPLPWYALLTGTIWVALTWAFLVPSGGPAGRVAYLGGPLGLALLGICLDPGLAALLAAGWLGYLAANSAGPNRVLLRQFARAIVVFEFVDLLLKHGTVVLGLNELAHRYTGLIHDSYGFGEISGAVRLDHRLLVFTVVAATPWVEGVRGRFLLPLLQALVVAAAVPARQNLGPEAPSLIACLSAAVIVHALHRAAGVPAAAPPARPRRALLRTLHVIGLAGLSLPVVFRAAGVVTPGRGEGGAGRARTVLFVNDHAPGSTEGGERDITHFAPVGRAATVAEFDKGREDPRYHKLAGQLLPALGYQVAVKTPGELEPEDYGRYDVVVLICLQARLPPGHKEALYESVRAGATSVLIVGDHTDIMGVQGPFNDIMAPLGVHLNYDSAYPMGEWDRQIVYSLHPVNGTLALAPAGVARSPGVSVGASLSLDWAVARPVLEAGDGFLDAGTPAAPSIAGLGDMQYTNNEVRGGFVLAAERPLGRGTFLAFGDTAFLQTGTLSRNYAYVASVFRYLSDEGTPARTPWAWVAGLVGGVSALGALYVRFSWPYAVACLALPLAGVVWTSTLQDSRQVVRQLDANLLIVDTGHGEIPVRSDPQRGTTVLEDLLDSQDRLLTIECDACDVLDTGRVECVVLLAPRARLAAADQNRLLEFVAGGGKLLITMGYFEAREHDAWLSRLGCRVTPLVLGAGQQVSLSDTRFQTPPRLTEAWGLDLANEWHPVVTCYDQPVVAAGVFGHGRVWIAADSFILLDGVMAINPFQADSDSFLFWSRLLGDVARPSRPPAKN